MTSIQPWEPKAGLAVLEKQYGNIMASERDTEVRKLGVLLDKGFDPALHLMVYQGRLAVKIEGMYWWRDGDKRFRRMKSHPIDPALKAAYGCAEDEIGVITEIFLQGQTEPCCEGFGKASMRPYTYRKNESPWDHPDRKRNPIDAEHTYRMAEKRSENQAIKKFRPLGIEIETPEEMVEGEGHVIDDEPPVKGISQTSVGASEAQGPAKASEAPQTGKAAPVETPLQDMNKRATALAGKYGLTADELKAWCNEAANKAFPLASMTWANAGIMEKNAALDVFARDYAKGLTEQ